RRHDRIILPGPGWIPALGETLRPLPPRPSPQLLAERRALPPRGRNAGLSDEPGELPRGVSISDRRHGPVLPTRWGSADGDRLSLSPEHRQRRRPGIQPPGVGRLRPGAG